MSILNQPHFQDEHKAREYLERIRWSNGVSCPHCGVVGEHYKIVGKTTRPGLYKCTDCREQFTVTVGTVFERSKIKLHIWLQATHYLCASKKGMSSLQLQRMLGVTYKTAWFMTHRIREAMSDPNGGLLGGGGGIVEADETYWGHCKQSKKFKEAPAKGGHGHKEKIMSLVERGGKVRSFHVANVTAKTVRKALDENVCKSAHLMTDEGAWYETAGCFQASHGVVKHSKGEYARGNVHSNTVEGYFSLLKRGLIGTFHHVGPQHLQRYVREFDFRYNHRQSLGYTDSERTDIALKGIAGKRLTYRQPSSQKITDTAG